jgi:hypothetical protein
VAALRRARSLAELRQDLPDGEPAATLEPPR